MPAMGHNRLFWPPLAQVRSWGKSGSRCVRAPMKTEAASAGVFDTPFGKFARLQILTIEDLFAGKKPAMPPQDQRSCSALPDPAAFKKAAREEEKTLKLL